MGWFWGSTGQDGSESDARSKLDSGLRDFLDKESAGNEPTTKGNTGPAQAPRPSNQPSTAYRSQLGLDVPGVDTENQNATPRDRPAVPNESLYQDGRYAHLWKDYRPLSEIEASSRSDQDKLAQVVESYHDRKAAIGRAAIENCVMEQLAEKECFMSGDMSRLMTMCKTENKAFNRCYIMQSRFLKALGYLSNQLQTQEEEEKIQMHADKLYHEMLGREKQIAQKKGEGEEAPTFKPLIQAEITTKALGEDSAWARARQKAHEHGVKYDLSSYSPERQRDIKDRIAGMDPHAKELELQLIAAESRAQIEYAEQVRDELEMERLHRADRRDRGKESFGDTIKRLWGWDR